MVSRLGLSSALAVDESHDRELVTECKNSLRKYALQDVFQVWRQSERLLRQGTVHEAGRK